MASQNDGSELTPASVGSVWHPYNCPTARFDGGVRDPRTLVYLYQQRMRATLLARVAEEATHPSDFSRTLTVVSCSPPPRGADTALRPTRSRRTR